MVTCIDEWEEAGVSQYSFLDRSLEILQSKRLLVDFDKDRVFYNHVLCLLMRDGASCVVLPDGTDGEPLAWTSLVN